MKQGQIFATIGKRQPMEYAMYANLSPVEISTLLILIYYKEEKLSRSEIVERATNDLELYEVEIAQYDAALSKFEQHQTVSSSLTNGEKAYTIQGARKQIDKLLDFIQTRDLSQNQRDLLKRICHTEA